MKKREKERGMTHVVGHCPVHGSVWTDISRTLLVTPAEADPYCLWPCPTEGCDYVRVVNLGEERNRDTLTVLLQAGVPELRLSPRPDGPLTPAYAEKFTEWLQVDGPATDV